MTEQTTSRYGIYFAPSVDSLLYRLGNTWLGRDVSTGSGLDPALSDGITHANWMAATESPRRYGFHATLKPPFHLAENATLEELQQALSEVCSQHAPFETAPLQVSQLGRFIALTLTHPSIALSKLADACVLELDRFRTVPTEAEMAKRLKGGMSEQERKHVLRWGYPYVFDTWKFHMTLTSFLQPDELQTYVPYLENRFAAVCAQPLQIDSVCIFHEPFSGAPFRLVHRVPLRGL